MKNLINIVLVLFLYGLLSVCSREQSDNVIPKPVKIEKSQKLLISANNNLGFNVYKSVFNKDNLNSNILISPVSLNKPLCTFLYGTTTNKGSKKVLHISDLKNEISLNCIFEFQTGITESPFYLNPGKSKFVEMLICESKYNFYSETGFNALEMPLGRSNFNTLIILPGENQSIETLKNKLSPYFINKLKKRFRKLNLLVFLPQLDIDYTCLLNDSIKKQDFRNLSSTKGLYLNELSQSIKLKTISKPANKKVLFDSNDENKNSFFIDRPFLIIITEKYSGSILFIGQITNPVK